MLNWLLRYAPVVDLVSRDGRSLDTSVLDVGCGPHGLACALPEAEFTGVDVLFAGPVAPTMTAVRSAAGPLPFRDASFATVVCLDVLEHVPPADRAGLVAELARVAAHRVVVACPLQGAAEIDDHVRTAFERAGARAPEWLDEHAEHGLPSEDEVRGACTSVEGFTARPLAMANGLLSAMVAVLETTTPFAARAAAASREDRERWLGVFRAGAFGEDLRGAWVLERDVAACPLVRPDDVPGGTAAALRCPACAGEGLGPEAGALACPACGHGVARDPHGAWDVAARPGWSCQPSWEPGPLAALLDRFLAAHPDTGSLALHAPPERCDEATAVARVLEALAGRPVPDAVDIDIVTAPLDRDRARGRVLVEA